MAKSKSIAGKIVAGALALCVAAGGVTLLGYTSRDNNGNWFGGLHWADNNITADGDDVKNVNGGAVITEGLSSGMRLMSTMIAEEDYEEYGVSALAENAYSLSVTYTPSDTTYKKTNFTAAFKNPSSTWASGKKVTDYVTVTATGDTTATLTVLQPFSEQIIVTAANNKNSSVKATTTVDYVGTWSTDLFTVGSIENDICYRTATVVNGTIEPDIADGLTVTYYFESVANAMRAKGYTNFPETYTESVDVNDYDFNGVSYILYTYCYNACGSPNLAKYKNDLSSVILAGQKPENMSGDEIFTYTLVSHRVYNGVTYGDVTLADGGSLSLTNWTGFEVVATSMSTNSPSIIAG